MKGLTGSRKYATWLMILAMIPSATGCVGLAAQILYVWKGTSVPPECRDLEHKKVAVLCISDEGYFDNAGLDEISRKIEINLKKNVKGIKLVPHKEVADWLDSTDSYKLDPRELGRSVKCERLLFVEIKEFSITEGETLFRGRARWKATVYDIANGGEVMNQTSFQDFRFPTHTERPQIEQREDSFRDEFTWHLSRVIARRYHAYDKLDDIASDTPSAG